MYDLIRQIIHQHDSPPYACTLNGHVLAAICQIAYMRTLEPNYENIQAILILCANF